MVPNGDVDALSDAIQNFIAMGSSVEYAPKCVESTRSYHIDVVMKDWLKLRDMNGDFLMKYNQAYLINIC